jgi:hypothetical protein
MRGLLDIVVGTRCPRAQATRTTRGSRPQLVRRALACRLH